MPIQPEKWNSESLPVGPDTDPNDDTPAAVGLSTGGFALTWVRAGLGGALNTVQVRLYDAFGTASPGPITIDSNTTVGVFDPDIAAFASGNFVVAYRVGAGDISFSVRDVNGGLVLAPTALASSGATESDVALAYHTLDGTQSVLAVWEDSGGEDGAGFAIRGRYILPNGALSGAEFTINAQTAGDQVNPDIAASATGLNAIVWTDMNANSGDIKLRTVTNVTGGPEIAEMTVNNSVTGLQDNASVVVLTTGVIVVGWESGTGVYFRVISAAGAFLTADVLVSASGLDAQFAPTADGGFTIVYRQSGLDGSGGTLRMAAYDSTHTRVGLYITANTTTLNDQEEPDVAMLEDGRHILVFSDESTGANDDVRYQIIDSRTQTFAGSSGDDTLVGRATGMTFANDVINGLDGADQIFGLSGDDTLNGGAGDDRLTGGDGVDQLDGGDGGDVLDGGGGGDALIGGAGDDWFLIDALDTYEGGSGFDRIYWQSAGSFSIGMVSKSMEFAVGGADADILNNAGAGPGLYYLYGQGGNDTLTGGAGDDVMYSGTGTDGVMGGDGNDWIFVDELDSYDGGAGFDRLYWGTNAPVSINMVAKGVEFVVTNDGADIFDNSAAGPGLYYIYSQGGNDTLTGGAGDDVMYSGTGSDNLSGGDGNDWLFVDQFDAYAGGAGFDRLFWESAAPLAINMTTKSVESVEGGSGADNIDNSAAGPGFYYLIGGAGNDTLTGGAGEDVMYSGAGADTVNGGGGDDWLFIDELDTYSAGTGFDRLYWQSSASLNVNMVAKGVEFVDGGSGADVIDNSGAGAGFYYLYGEGGADTLIAGAGVDNLYGGTGADAFRFTNGWGADTIGDFSRAEGDRIDLTQISAPHAFASLLFADTSGGTLITIAGLPGVSIFVAGVAANSWTSGDFLL